jgi:hypothetical protein
MSFLNRSSLSVLCIALFCGFSNLAHSEETLNYSDKGRFGVMGAITEDMWKGGFVYEAPDWEFNMIGHYGITDGDTIETHVITKLGARWDIGHQNFFSAGIDYQMHPGRKEAGVSLSSEYQVGPYIGFQRHFAGSPVMLTLWVNPFQFDHGATVNAGQVVHTNSRHFFQTGGFGVAYLF